MTKHVFMILQIRDAGDSIRDHEIQCFMRSTGQQTGVLRIVALLNNQVTAASLEDVDMVFIGGSGAYSATDEGDWIGGAMESLRVVHASQTPTFASCWGHQALARAMGGRVENHPDSAEVGTIPMTLTAAGSDDPVFGGLPSPFHAQVGHEDSVMELPPNTTIIAGSERCRIHAYRFDDAPIYCTQFHPELTHDDLLMRLDAYPEYVERIAGLPMDEFKKTTQESPEASGIIAAFVSHALGH